MKFEKGDFVRQIIKPCFDDLERLRFKFRTYFDWILRLRDLALSFDIWNFGEFET